MNINELFKIQAELDNRIVEEHNLQGQDLLNKKVVALLTELFECVNEARFFKFWSKDQKARTEIKHLCPYCDKGKVESYPGANFEETCDTCEGDYVIGESNPLLEEYVDTLHFALSIANDLGYTEHEYKETKNYDLNRLVTGLTNLITLLTDTREERRHITTVLNLLIKLGYQLGFDEETVVQAYMDKNKVNHARQENGY